MLRPITIAITALIVYCVSANDYQSQLNDIMYEPLSLISDDSPSYPPHPCQSPTTTTPKPKPPTCCNQKSLAEISNTVTCKLLKEIIKNYPNGGFTVAVFNILHVLLMVANAAAGNTRYQLANNYLGICDLNKINTEFRGYLGQLKDNLTSDGKQKTLVIPAAGIFIENKFPVKPEYKQNMNYYYGAPAMNEPFSSDPSTAVNDINEFIRKLTQDFYKKFFPAPFDRSTVVVEVSTFYLLSSWLTSDYFTFNPAKQYFSPTCTDKPIYAQYLNNDQGRNPAGYAVIDDGTNGKWVTVRVPLYTKKYSVILIQPQSPCSQKAVNYLKNLTPAKIAQLFKSLANYRTDCQVWFEMPQFKVNSTFNNVIDYLKAGGVYDLFENADLRNGIVQSQVAGITKVDTIVHKCDVSMNKTGVLAVAATTVGITTTSVRVCEGNLKPVKFNSPFVFLIVENTKNLIVFSGSVNTPNYPLVSE